MKFGKKSGNMQTVVTSAERKAQMFARSKGSPGGNGSPKKIAMSTVNIDNDKHYTPIE
jgi:hypothetical protein